MLCLRAKFFLFKQSFFRNWYMNSVFKIAFSIKTTTARLSPCSRNGRNFNDFIPCGFTIDIVRVNSNTFTHSHNCAYQSLHFCFNSYLEISVSLSHFITLVQHFVPFFQSYFVSRSDQTQNKNIVNNLHNEHTK